MNMTKELLAEYASKLATAKKTPPAVSFALKDIKVGKSVSLELAVKVAVFLLSYDSDIDLATLCDSLGHTENKEAFDRAYSEHLAESVLGDGEDSDEEESAETDTELVSADKPVSSAPPAYIGIYLSKYGHAQRKSATDFNSSDECLARIALHCVAKDSVLKCRDLDKWYTWTGFKWKESCMGDIRVILDGVRECIKDDLSNLRYKYRYQKPQVVDAFRTRLKKSDISPEKIDKLVKAEMSTMAKMINRLSSIDSKNAVVKTIGDHVMRDSSELDQNKDSLVFRNVTWDAATNVFSAPNPSLLSTRCINTDWENPSLQAIGRFKEFLSGLGFDDETVAFLKRSFGYGALGRGTAKRFWWFRGQRNTGKTSLTQLVGKALDEYTEVTQTSVWLVKSGSRPGHTDDLAALRGSRMVICDEFPEVSRFDDSLLKQVTGGSIPMRASAKSEKGTTFRVSFALYFSSNFDPKISAEDSAALGRLTALTFKTIIRNGNESFVEEYMSDPDNRRAILQWVMEGAVEYIKYGFGDEPEAVRASREEFKDEQVSIQDQLRQILVSSPKSHDPAKTSIIKADLVELQKKTKEYSAMLSTKKLHQMIRDIFSVDAPVPSNGDYRWPDLSLVSSAQQEGYSRGIDWQNQQEFNEFDNSPN